MQLQMQLLLVARQGDAMASLKVKIAVSGFLLLCSLSTLLSSCGKRSQIDNVISIASPCILASEPSNYSGQKVKLTGYITSTKEGAYIWGDGCKTSGVVLHLGNALIQDAKFRDALSKHGLSPSPIKATLLGRFQYEHLTGVKTFEAEQVLDLQVIPTAEMLPSVGPNPPKPVTSYEAKSHDSTGTLAHESGHVDPPKPQ
jgi:hypothetical protein